jgi:hypothetical protein
VPAFDSSQSPALSRSLDTSIYSRRALAATQAAFRDHCNVAIRPSEHGRLLVTVTPLSSEPADIRATVLEFWNYLLDTACQERLG